MQQIMKETLAERRLASQTGQLATRQYAEINLTETFPDGHYSGSPDFDPKVYGAD
jgi:hypothetical protein